MPNASMTHGPHPHVPVSRADLNIIKKRTRYTIVGRFEDRLNRRADRDGRGRDGQGHGRLGACY